MGFPRASGILLHPTSLPNRFGIGDLADIAIVPFQDLLGLGTDARMNLPNSTQGNWSWRFRQDALTEDHSERVRDMTATYGRIQAIAGRSLHRFAASSNHAVKFSKKMRANVYLIGGG